MGKGGYGLVLLTSTAVLAAAKLQPLNVKLGLWEVTQTSTISGQPPVPADMLSKLSPEQRARIEERLKANAGDKTRATTYKSCLTKEKLEQDPAFVDKSKSKCTWTVIASTSSKADAHGVCMDGGVKVDVTLHVEALNTESVKASSQGSASAGGHTMNSNSTYVAKWVGPACGNTK